MVFHFIKAAKLFCKERQRELAKARAAATKSSHQGIFNEPSDSCFLKIRQAKFWISETIKPG